jgi:hypothetical protein
MYKFEIITTIYSKQIFRANPDVHTYTHILRKNICHKLLLNCIII